MKRIHLLAAALLFGVACDGPQSEPLTLWYDRPAAHWEEIGRASCRERV